MNQDDSKATQARILAVFNRQVVQSARGWTAYEIQDATDFLIGLSIDPEPAEWADTEHFPERFEVSDIFHVPVTLRPEFQQTAAPIDLRGNVPEQVADRLRGWATKLSEMAAEVLRVRHVPYEHGPQAYVTRDAKTGDVLGARMLLSESAALGTGFEDITNGDAVTQPDRIQNWPELSAKFQEQAKAAASSVELA